jgi:hypothetical protein
MPNDYKLARQARKDDGNRSRIVIEPAQPEVKRPVQPNWPPKVTDENSYDRNTFTPEQMIQKTPGLGGKEPIKTA